MKTENNYNTRTLFKDLAKLKKSAQSAAKQAVLTTVEQTAAFQMSFDETEVVPYAVNENGNIVISVTNTNPAALEELVAITGAKAVEILKQDFVSNIKEAMK